MNFYLVIKNQAAGPYPTEQISQMLAENQITSDSPCCREGDSEWKTVAHFIKTPLASQASPTASAAIPEGPYRHSTYLIRKKVFKLFGGAFHIYAPDESVAFYCEQKAFRLKDDLRVFDGEAKQTEVLTIKGRKILDISASHDVVDPITNTPVGALKMKALKSLLKEEWIFMDPTGREIGLIQEDSLLLAILRRLFREELGGRILPKKYHGMVGETVVCTFRQNFNPFVMKITLDFSHDTQGLLDRRLGIAAAILLCGMEAKGD